MEHTLRNHLGWNRPLARQFGHSRLVDGIDVYIDFDWKMQMGHRRLIFPNYLHLARYIQKHCTNGKTAALILTDQNHRAEGCHDDHPAFQIYIVNIVRYKEVAKNDAAGAYFAGLQGAPRISAADISVQKYTANDAAIILDAIGSDENVAAWIKRHPDDLASIIAELGELPLQSAGTEHLVAEFSRRLKSANPEERDQICAILCADDFPSSILRSANFAKRQNAVEQFRIALEQDLWSEREWQAFFEREDWIFGYGLLYQLQQNVEREGYVGGKMISNAGGQLTDFMVKTVGYDASFIGIVDIKRPSTRLICPTPCRSHTHAIESDFAQAVAQILSNCDRWNRVGSKLEENVRKASREGWTTAQPRGILVIGHTKSLDGSNPQSSEDMRQCFELFRRHMHGVEIITYDELYERAKALAAYSPTQPGFDGRMPAAASAKRP